MGRKRRPSKLKLNVYHFRQVSCENNKTVNFNEINEDYLNFRNYIVFNFIEPLKNKNFKEVQENYFNFEYIEAKLATFNQPKLAGEINLLKEIISVAKYATDTRFTLDKNYQQMYGDARLASMVVETSRIVYETKFEIYHIIFGDPRMEKKGYDKELLEQIGNIVDVNPGITVKQVRKKLKL